MKPNNTNFSGIRHIMRALVYRNYRLFFSGQIISLSGTWMQNMAMGWLVYRLTNSPFLLGVIGFSSQITSFFISPFAGVWADRWNRRRLIIITQSLAMAQAFILAFLVMAGLVRVWHIIALSVFLGLVSSLDMPVRQAFTVDMIENKEDLGNAIALNSMMFNIARFIGPTLAGILVSGFGEGICFLLNGFSYLAVIFSLLMMRIPLRKIENRNNHILASMKEGFIYTFGFAPMRFILLLMGLVSLIVMPYAVLMPVFARDILHGDSQTLGFLLGAAGLGALAGAVYLAAKKDVRGLGRLIAVATFILGIGLILFSLSRALWLSLILMVFIGFGMMVHMASSNTVLQTIVDDDKRGRVMGFFMMAFIGLTPFGSLLAGSLASNIGTPNTILIAGLICILGGIVFTRKVKIFNAIAAKSSLTEI
jgi:MFS family permease